MRIELLKHLLDIAYPTAQLPVDIAKINTIYDRFDTELERIELTDDGKVIGGNYFICDLRKGKEFLDYGISAFDSIADEITVTISKPNQSELLYLIKELNDRELTVSNVNVGTYKTTIKFETNY